MHRLKLLSINDFISRIKTSSLFKDSFWALLGSVVGKGLSLIAGIFIARFLGKDVFGEYGVIKNTLVYIAIVSTLGFGYTATYFIAKNIADNKEKVFVIIKGVYYVTLLTSFILCFLLFIFAKEIAFFIHAETLVDALRAFSVSIIFNAISTSQIGILSGFKSFKIIAVNNTYSGVLVFVLSLILTYYYKLNGAVFALLISFIFQSILNHFSINKCLKLYPKIKSKNKVWSEVKEMCSFSLPIALQESLYSIVQWLSLYLLLKYGSYGEVGISSAASQWSAMVIFIPGVLKNVMFSYLSSAKEHNNLLKRLLTINFIATIIPFIFVILFSNFICSFYGNTFINLRSVLLVSVFSTIFVCMSEVYCYEFISKGRTWFVFIMRFIRDVLKLVICFILFNIYTHDQALIWAIITTVMSSLYLLLLAGYYHKNYILKKKV